MKIYFIGCGPGDKELLTLKGKKIIEQADMIIYAGSLIDKGVLSFAKKEASLHDSAKLNLDEINCLYKQAKENNQLVARLHSGDPSIYGAINEQIALAEGLGIDYEIIPGVSSFVAAAASLKTEFTIPEISQTVILTRISGKTTVPQNQSLSSLAKHRATMCIFLSIQKIAEVIEELSKEYPSQTPAAVVYKASRDDELVIKGTLSDIARKTTKAKISKTALIIVGESLDSRQNVSKLYDKAFSHMYRKAKV